MKFFILYLILISNTWAETKEIFYQNPINTDTFQIDKGDHLIIRTNQPVKILANKIIINGVLSIKERLYKTKTLTIKNQNLTRLISNGEDGESIGNFSGGKGLFGNGGGGASSTRNGINADIKGDTLNVIHGKNSVATGGQGGLVGDSGGILILDTPIIKISGLIDLKGEKASPPQKSKNGTIILKEQCNPYECCLESGSKGMCLEVGTCYKECKEPLSYTIGAGGKGSNGAPGFLLINTGIQNSKINIPKKNILLTN